MDALKIATMARDALREKKGAGAEIFDVRGVSPVTDFYVIADGASPPQLRAMAQETQRALKTAGVDCYRHSGDPDSGWVVLDFVDAVIHIFSTEARRYYALEELWARAPRIP